MKRAMWIGVAATAGGALAGAAYWLLSTSRAFVQKAPYLIRHRDGRFEVREYPPLAIATASTQGDERRGAFERLFRFTERANTRAEKIAMTTPVLIEPARGTMSFVMPVETELRGVPGPVDPSVSVRERPGGFVAAYRFPGRPTAENEERALDVLRRWMTGEGLESAGEPPVIAYYDAPWIPWPLRRNEVMLSLGRELPRSMDPAVASRAAGTLATG